MQTVVIVIHLMIVASLIAVVLLQKSEGGGPRHGRRRRWRLHVEPRATTNLLTRTTAILAGGFFRHQPVPVLVCGQPARAEFDYRRAQLDIATRRARARLRSAVCWIR